MTSFAQYSDFFSSGLRANQPPSPSTPRQPLASLDDDVTPTATTSGEIHTAAATSYLLPALVIDANAKQDAGHPLLRRRRSSLTTATSPLATIKSTGLLRAAANSVQKQSLISLSPSRPRSGSIHEHATQGNSMMGRLRSGSIGTSLRSRRVVRRQAPAPPPTAPLPALPSLPTTPRRRSDVDEHPLPSSPDYGMFAGDVFSLPTTPLGSPSEGRKLFGKQLSPLDSPVTGRTTWLNRSDDDMQEN